MSSIDWSPLREAARRAYAYAHVPYSQYPVGAALLTADGSLITGVNVENASYGLTICAERSAVVQAIARGHREFRAVAVAASRGSASPCGACRQVLAEFAGPEVPISFQDPAGEWVTRRLGELLPDSFSFAKAAEEPAAGPEKASS